jgi:hypothetical protein
MGVFPVIHVHVCYLRAVPLSSKSNWLTIFKLKFNDLYKITFKSISGKPNRISPTSLFSSVKKELGLQNLSEQITKLQMKDELAQATEIEVNEEKRMKMLVSLC